MSGGLSEAAQDTAASVGAGAHAGECTHTPAAPLPGGLPNPEKRALNPDDTCKPHFRALLVEDDVEYAGLVLVMLNSVASVRFQAGHTTSAHAAIERLSHESYDVLLLDLGLPDAQGLEALHLLLPAVPDLPIVVLSGTDNEDLALRAVKAGAQDYLIKGETTTDLLARAIRYAIERKQSELHIKHLAYYDSLTQLPNRRLLMDRLSSALTRARRNGHVVGVVFLDIDHFKQINDTLGHEAGDSVLRELANRLPRTLRESDTLARLSGDEFVAVVEVKRQQELLIVAESLRRQLAMPFTTAGRELLIKTSIGVSSYPGDGAYADDLLRSADRAMYRAKAEERGAIGSRTVTGRKAHISATRSPRPDRRLS